MLKGMPQVCKTLAAMPGAALVQTDSPVKGGALAARTGFERVVANTSTTADLQLHRL